MQTITKLIITATLAACGGRTQEVTVGTSTLTGSTNVSRAFAIDRLTTERCQRLLSCAHIGPGQAWSDVDECRDGTRESTSGALKAAGSSCSSVDFYDLAVCDNAIRAASCSADLMRLAECDGAKICR